MSDNKQDDVKQPAGAKRGRWALVLFTAVGWLAAGTLVADRIHAQDMTSSLHNALVRSQTERHELSQELARMTEELAALEKRLSRYRDQQSQAAATP
jgi:septal ring factor EnvC (AmiA/AmiB activator)